MREGIFTSSDRYINLSTLSSSYVSHVIDLLERNRLIKADDWGSLFSNMSQKDISIVNECSFSDSVCDLLDNTIKSRVLELLATDHKLKLIDGRMSDIECNSLRCSCTILDETN